MATYADEIRSAYDDIRAAGGMHVIEQTAPVPDTDEPWKQDPPAVTLTAVAAVFLNFGGQTNGVRYFEGNQVLTGDKKILVAAQGAPNIAIGDVVVRSDGQRWRVEAFKLLDPNGERILYTIQGRQ